VSLLTRTASSQSWETEISGHARATLLHSNRCVIARFGAHQLVEGSAMADKPQQRDMRDSHRTDESRAAEKKVGDSPFDGESKRPQDAPTEAPTSTINQ
jgi:hypothetical protein